MLVDIDIIINNFNEKSTYKIEINKERLITTKGVYASLVGILFFLLFLSW